MKRNISKFEKKINVKFKNKSLLIESLTHKSSNNKTNNEKLEFLGDRVIALVLAKKLFNNMEIITLNNNEHSRFRSAINGLKKLEKTNDPKILYAIAKLMDENKWPYQ